MIGSILFFLVASLEGRLNTQINFFMKSEFFLENFLNNSSFFFLLCSISFYWIRAFLNISFFSNIGKFTIISANLTMFFLLIYRGILENHFPLSNHAIKKEYHSFIQKSYFQKYERKKNRILFFSNLIFLSPISSKNKFIDTFDFNVIE